MKVFDLEELSLKTERFTDSENIDFCVSLTIGGITYLEQDL